MKKTRLADRPDQFLKPVVRLWLGWDRLGFGSAGGGKSPKSEPVWHFFAPFSHIFANFLDYISAVVLVVAKGYLENRDINTF